MSFIDGFMILVGLIGAGCFAFGIASAVAAWRLQTPTQKPEAVRDRFGRVA